MISKSSTHLQWGVYTLIIVKSWWYQVDRQLQAYFTDVCLRVESPQESKLYITVDFGRVKTAPTECKE